MTGTAVALYGCHPNGTAECGYKNQQYKTTISNGHATIKNINSGTCLTGSAATAGATVTIHACKVADPNQEFSFAHGELRGPGGLCLTYGKTDPTENHCCKSGWVRSYAQLLLYL